MENDQKADIIYGDDLEKCIERYSFEFEDSEIYIPIDLLKQILDHFMPIWRKRHDKYYKYKKFATEQQLDKNLNNIRTEIDKRFKELEREIIKAREFKDEFECEAAEVKRIIEQNQQAIEMVRIMKEKQKQRGGGKA